MISCSSSTRQITFGRHTQLHWCLTGRRCGQSILDLLFRTEFTQYFHLLSNGRLICEAVVQMGLGTMTMTPALQQGQA